MREAFLIDGVAQCSYDMILPEDVFKRFGAVFSGKNLVAHGLTIGPWRDLSLPVFGFYFDASNCEGFPSSENA